MLGASFTRIFSAFICLYFLLNDSARAKNLISDSKKDIPIIIKSDRLEVDDELKLITFTGNVVATKGELKIRCKKMVVYYKSKNPASNRSRVSKIVATGDVRIYRGKQGGIATSDKAIYYQEKDMLVLTGKPVVKQGRDFVEGGRIIIYLKENRSVVESSKNKPVKAIIFPKKE